MRGLSFVFILIAFAGNFLPELHAKKDDRPKSPVANRVGALIAALASDDYTTRESASDELARIGLPALSALEAAASHPDREVRYRSQRALALIRQHDHERRLEVFLSGKDDDEEYPLPGWTRFRKTFGDGAQERLLFVEMQRADPELLHALENDPRRAAELVVQRTTAAQQAIQLGVNRLAFGHVVAGLFVAAQPDVALPTQSLAILFGQCLQPRIREGISTGARHEIPRKMLGSIVSRADDDAVYQALAVARELKLKEGIAPAAKILKNHEVRPIAPMAHEALKTIAGLGDESHLPLVETERLMRDSTPVGQFQENGTTYVIQLRDVALAAAVLLSKQDLRTYFDIPREQALTDPQMIFLNARLIGFPSEEQRAVVFAKWRKNKAN
jgi:hypothetical protein